MVYGAEPPDGTTRLGEKLKHWIVSVVDFVGIGPLALEIHARKVEVFEWFRVEGIPRMHGRHLDWMWQSAFAMLYWVTGIDMVEIKSPVDPGASPFENPSEFLGSSIRSAMENPVTGELVQVMGALITDPVLAALEAGLEAAETNPHEAARAFHGTVAAISSVSGLTSTVVEALTGGQIDTAGKALEGMYWNLGLGFLGWQTLAPLLENGLQPPLRRHYNLKYRPERFSAAQMSDLFALGEVAADDVREVLRNNGWRDADIEQWIRLSYRNLSEGDIWLLYHDGIINKSQSDGRLRALGYSPSDLPLLYKANEKSDTTEIKDILLSTAKGAYRENLLSREDFAGILRDQKHSEQEITLQLALLDMQKAEEQAAFSRSEVRELYNSRTIAKPEAIAYLIKTDLSAEQAELLLASWDAVDAPEPLRINQATIREAFTDGVLTRSDAKSRLITVGYLADEAELLLRTWETEAPSPTVVPGPEGAGALSLSTLSQLAAAGLITEVAMAARPELERFDQADRERLITLMYTVPTVEPETLSEAMLREAFVDGVLTRADAKDRLITVGYLADEAELLLRTWETEAPSPTVVPGPRGAGALSLSTLSQLAAAELIDETAMAERPELEQFDQADRERLVTLMYTAPTITSVELSETTLVEAYRFDIISRSELASRLLDRGLSQEDVDLALQIIDAEIKEEQDWQISSAIRRPSVGSLQLALQRGLIDEAYFRAQLLELGFNEDAVRIYQFHAQYQAPARPLDLPRATVLALYKDQDITRSDTQYRLVKLGYTVADAQLLIKNERMSPIDTEIGEAYMAGLMLVQDAMEWFDGFGFTVDEIDAFFLEFPPS